MSILRSAGTGAAWATLAGVAIKILALANVFLILRQLSVYEYGLIQLVFTVSTTIAGILLPGLGSVLISDLSREKGDGKEQYALGLAKQYFLLQTFLGIVAFTALFVSSGFLAEYLGRPIIGYYLAIAAFILLFSPLRGIIVLLASIELKFALQAALTVIEEGAKLVLLLLFFFGLNMGIAGALYAMVFAPLVAMVLVLPWAIPLLMPLLRAPRHDESWWRLVTAHRFWGMASSYLTTLNQNTRLWFIQLFLGTEAVGLFSFAQGLATQAMGLVTFSSITTPIIAQAARLPKRLADLGNRALKYQLWIALAALIPGALVTPYFIRYFFPEYAGAIAITLIALIIIIPSAINVPVAALYAALQKQRQYFFRATLLKTVILLIILPPLLAAFGIVGAMIEFVLTNILSVFERTRSLRPLVPGFMASVRSFIVFEKEDRDILSRIGVSIRPQRARATLSPYE